ncbi:alpha/beta fold hydrolase [Candidatus Woesearchaeota archaeon]|nr:alpha/beta fold hydrolase [Candidatus Woesearchaeota archaeon]
MQIWLKTLLFVVLFLVIFSLLTFLMSIHPKKITTNLIPSDLGLKYEEVSFKSTDGIKLSGWLIPNNKTKSAIIVMHGYPADKANLLEIAEFLAKDFNVFLFDFRSFGNSEGRYTTAGYLEKKDLLGAIKYLEKEKNMAEIGLYGFSLGGAVALMAKHDNVKAVVTDSAYAKLTNMVEHMYGMFFIFKYPLAYLTKLYGLLFLNINIGDASPADSIKHLEIPILIIHAEKDSQIPVNEAYLLHDANKKAELWIVEDADHGMTHSVNPEKYEKKVIGFFKESIK